MKEIKAYVRANMANHVIEALASEQFLDFAILDGARDCARPSTPPLQASPDSRRGWPASPSVQPWWRSRSSCRGIHPASPLGALPRKRDQLQALETAARSWRADWTSEGRARAPKAPPPEPTAPLRSSPTWSTCGGPLPDGASRWWSSSRDFGILTCMKLAVPDGYRPRLADARLKDLLTNTTCGSSSTSRS